MKNRQCITTGDHRTKSCAFVLRLWSIIKANQTYTFVHILAGLLDWSIEAKLVEWFAVQLLRFVVSFEDLKILWLNSFFWKTIPLQYCWGEEGLFMQIQSGWCVNNSCCCGKIAELLVLGSDHWGCQWGRCWSCCWIRSVSLTFFSDTGPTQQWHIRFEVCQDCCMALCCSVFFLS